MTGAGAVLSFQVGRQALALPAEAVAEVVPIPPVTRIPQAPASLRGVANLRGRVAPVVSLRRLLGEDDDKPGGRLIVLRGEEPVGLTVDAADSLRGLVEGEAVLPIEALLAEVLATLPRRDAASANRPTEAAPQDVAEEPSIAFLEFTVAGQAFALALEQVSEVISTPSQIMAVPHARPAVVGAILQRGRTLPLIALRTLLGFGQTGGVGGWVVVARLGEAEVGLVVEGVSTLLRTRESEIGATPSLLNRGGGQATLDAILQVGGRLVSVLATEHIFDEATVADLLADSHAGLAEATAGDGEGRMEKFIVFRLADEAYGLPISAVAEVVRMPAEVTHAPGAPSFLADVMNHRGAPTPLIDLRARFAVGGELAAEQKKVMIVQLDDVQVGFVVDAVTQVASVPATALAATPELAGDAAPVFDRIVVREVETPLVLVVEPAHLLAAAERDLVRGLAEQAGGSPA